MGIFLTCDGKQECFKNLLRRLALRATPLLRSALLSLSLCLLSNTAHTRLGRPIRSRDPPINACARAWSIPYWHGLDENVKNGWMDPYVMDRRATYCDEVRMAVLMAAGAARPSRLDAPGQLDRAIVQLASKCLPQSEALTFFHAFSSGSSWQDISRTYEDRRGRQVGIPTIKRYARNALNRIVQFLQNSDEERGALLALIGEPPSTELANRPPSPRLARDTSEIDAFATRVSSAAEQFKASLTRLRAGRHTQVKIYVDHSNFIAAWTQAVHSRDRPLQHDLDWHALPQVLLEETATWLTAVRKAPPALLYRGMHVYGTLFEDDYFKLLETTLRREQPDPHTPSLPIRLRKDMIDKWREENEAYKLALTREIRNVPGCVVVPIYRRTPSQDQLSAAQYTAGGIPIAPEKIRDTYIATDLIGDATFDAYDIALLVSEDSDFIPAIEFVQQMRSKRVVHVGFGDHTNHLRLVCQHRIDLAKNSLLWRLQRPGS